MNIENDWQQATGPVPYKLTNDYLFRAVMQENEEARKSLIASVLGRETEDILTAEILNPIELGKTIDSKDYILDVKVEVNKNEILNLEMQVVNENNWPERSLGYLCRTFDNLNVGDDYLKVKPAHLVSFLDFTLFPENNSYLSKYKLTNQENYKEIYTDKFTITVVNLRKTDKATDKDIDVGLQNWGSFFKAESWEEVKMLATKNENIENAAKSMFLISQDALIREQCERREGRIRAEQIKQQWYEQAVAEKEQAVAAVAEKERALADKDQVIADKDQALADKDRALADKDQALADKDRELAALKEQLNKLVSGQM